MHSRSAVVTAGLVLCVGGAAYADRGALAVDVGAGVALINVRAPYATGATSQIGSSWTTSPALRSYGLALADTSQSALVLAPSAGVEWTGDRFSIGIAPRVDLLVGSVRTWGVSLR